MRILTKQWMKLNRQVMLAGQIKGIDSSKSDIDKLYKKLYTEKLNDFIKSEKADSVYDEQPFDKEYAKELFKAKTEYNEQLVKELPKNVLSHIQNPELLGLKCCTKDELRYINGFYQKGLKMVEEKANKARQITENSAQFLSHPIDFDLITEEIVVDTIVENNNLIIEFDEYSLVAENVSIIKREELFVNYFDIDDPRCEMTVLHAIELYYNESKKYFTLHFLFDDIDKFDNPKLWYLTAKCKDIFLRSND